MNVFRTFTLVALLILAATIGAMWYLQTQSITKLQAEISRISTQPTSETHNLQTPAATDSTSTSTSGDDAVNIQAALKDLSTRVDFLEGMPTPTAISLAKTSAAPSTPFQKQVLSLGSWSSIRQDWAPTGLEITVNSQDYPEAVNASFEAGLNIVNGFASARLTNKTTGAIINLTEISNNSNTVTYKSSPSFKLHPGNNTYVVELRSSSGEVAYLSSSRIVIE